MNDTKWFYKWWTIVSGILIVLGAMLSFFINNVDAGLRLTLYYMLSITLIIILFIFTLLIISYTKQMVSIDLYKLKRESLVHTAIYLETDQSMYQMNFEETFKVEPIVNGKINSFSFSNKSNINLVEFNNFLTQDVGESKIKIENNSEKFNNAKIIYKRNVTP